MKRISAISVNSRPDFSQFQVVLVSLAGVVRGGRFTRQTNAFSKKAENHAHAVALHFMFYNFGRIHESLRIAPAMAAGVSDHIWSLAEIAALAS